MANKKISELTTGTPVNTDWIPYVDIAAGETKKATKLTLKGDTGAAATINVGSTTTGTPGSSASVANSGTTSAAIFNFTIPRGDVGATGATGATGPAGGGAGGNFTGPGSATDNAIIRFDGITGALGQNSLATINDSGSINIPAGQNYLIDGTPVSSGGGAPTDAQYVTLATNGTLTTERVLTGTSNQITVTDNGAGSTAVLSLPQNIHTAATPQFAKLGLGIASSSVALHIKAQNDAFRGQISLEATDYAQLTFYAGPTAQTNLGAQIYYDVGSKIFAINNLGEGSPGTILLSGSSINVAGHILAGTDNTYDIGASGSARPRTGYFASSLFVGDGSAGMFEVKRNQDAATNVYVTNETDGTLALSRMLFGDHAADTDLFFTSYNTGFSGNGLLGIAGAGLAEFAANTNATGIAVGTRGNAPFYIATNTTTRLTITGAGVVTFASDVNVPDEAYDATAWNGSLEVPTKNAVRDKIESLSVGSGITWTEVTGTSQSAAVNNAYITNNAGLVTVTLPTTAAVGAIVRVVGKGAGGWRIAQNASEIIHFGDTDTTTGTGGRLDSIHRRDAVELVCVVADTEWNIISSVGNITIT